MTKGREVQYDASCPRCGTAVLSLASRCKGCGEALARAAAVPPVAPAPATAASRRRTALWVAGPIALLAAANVAVWIAIRPAQPAPPPLAVATTAAPSPDPVASAAPDPTPPPAGAPSLPDPFRALAPDPKTDPAAMKFASEAMSLVCEKAVSCGLLEAHDKMTCNMFAGTFIANALAGDLSSGQCPFDAGKAQGCLRLLRSIDCDATAASGDMDFTQMMALLSNADSCADAFACL